MGRGRFFLERLAEEADISAEPVPGLPLIELAGEHRVLIENHGGVKGYSREKIIVGVKFGFIHICGCGLEILSMTKEQLLIRGRIDNVSLLRRNQK